MSNKYKKVFTALNYIGHFLILASAVSGCISISSFASRIGFLIGSTSSETELKFFATTAGIKKYKSIDKKKKKKHEKTVLLAKSKLKSISFLFSKALIDSRIKYDEFFSINNALKECDNIMKESTNLKT